MTVTGEDIRCFIDEFPVNLNQTFTSSVIRFCVLVDSATSTCGHIFEKRNEVVVYGMLPDSLLSVFRTGLSNCCFQSVFLMQTLFRQRALFRFCCAST